MVVSPDHSPRVLRLLSSLGLVSLDANRKSEKSESGSMGEICSARAQPNESHESQI